MKTNYRPIAHGTRCEEPGCDEEAAHIARDAEDLAHFFCEKHPTLIAGPRFAACAAVIRDGVKMQTHLRSLGLAAESAGEPELCAALLDTAEAYAKALRIAVRRVKELAGL